MLRVLTLNIWNLSGPWRDRRVEIVRWLDLLQPDVVCLQEVVEDADGRNQGRWLADAAAADYDVAWAGGSATGKPGVRVGNAVLSRWPIDATSSVVLPNDADRDDVERLVVHARTRGLDVFSTHLAWRFDVADLRRAQVLALVEFMDEAREHRAMFPPVLCGDFNAEPDSDEVRFLSGLTTLDGRATYFQDAWRVTNGPAGGATWDVRNPFAAEAMEPSRRIDYVFVGWRRVNGAGRVDACRLACDRALTGTFASDHLGVCADLDGPLP